MSPNDAVTVCYTAPNDAWKKDGTAFVRLRFTFKRQGRFMKTNILVRKKDMNGASLLNLWLSCKVKKQVGGYAPKNLLDFWP